MTRTQMREVCSRWRCFFARILFGSIVLITVSNVAFHSGIDEEAGVEWAAIYRMPDPSLTISKGIQQRYGLFFSLRDMSSRQTALEIPSYWDGAPQERQFHEFLRPVILGVSNIEEVIPSNDLRFDSAGDWWSISRETLEGDGLIVMEGRSRPNGRQPWYEWRIVSASESPPIYQLHVTSENQYLFLDPRVAGGP